MSRVSLDQILPLPTMDRVELAPQICESVVDCPKESQSHALTSRQRAELERRSIAFQRSPEEGDSWDEVMRSLLDE